MSVPSSRGQRGGSSTRGGRATPYASPRGRGNTRASSKSAPASRGRARGGSNSNATVSTGDGILQKLRAGYVKRGSENGTTTSGRGEMGASIPRMEATLTCYRPWFRKHGTFSCQHTGTRSRICQPIANVQRAQTSVVVDSNLPPLLSCALELPRFHECLGGQIPSGMCTPPPCHADHDYVRRCLTSIPLAQTIPSRGAGKSHPGWLSCRSTEKTQPGQSDHSSRDMYGHEPGV